MENVLRISEIAFSSYSIVGKNYGVFFPNEISCFLYSRRVPPQSNYSNTLKTHVSRARSNFAVINNYKQFSNVHQLIFVEYKTRRYKLLQNERCAHRGGRY